MALTTGEFQEITILASSATAWSALTLYPNMSAPLVEAQAKAQTVTVFVQDSVSGLLAFVGGAVSGLVDSVLASVSAPLTATTTTDTQGNVTWWAKNASNEVFTYTGSEGVLHKLDAAETAALKAFLP